MYIICIFEKYFYLSLYYIILYEYFITKCVFCLWKDESRECYIVQYICRVTQTVLISYGIIWTYICSVGEAYLGCIYCIYLRFVPRRMAITKFRRHVTIFRWPSRRTVCYTFRHQFDARFARKPLFSVTSKALLVHRY